METVEIRVPCTPAISTKLELLGERISIIVNENGGMGGSRVVLYGNVKPRDTMIDVELTETDRHITANPLFISRTEKVKFYKQTHMHNNSSFKPNEPMIAYYVAYGDVELVQSKSHSACPERVHPLVDKIEKKFC